MTVEEAREVLRKGQRLRIVVGESSEDPTLIVYLDGGMVISESVAGWSAGVVEPVCAIESEFLESFLDGRLSVAVAV